MKVLNVFHAFKAFRALKLLRSTGLALGLAALAGQAQAHPHGWIDLSVRVLTNDQGEVVGLHQAWRMDPFYSLVVMEELGRATGDDMDAGLDQLGREIRDNLVGQNYFTEIRRGGERLDVGEVTEYTTLQRDGRVSFMFVLPLAEPVPLAGDTLRYQVFDPSYYLEVLHEAENGEPLQEALVVRGELECERHILAADPDPEKVLQAALLDVDDQAEPGLGRHFAETGVITCP